jgi:microcystin-dependent protein
MATTIQVNKIIDVDKLKYEIEYSGDFKVTGILPKTSSTDAQISVVDASTLADLDAGQITTVTGIINLHISEQRKRILVEDLPDASDAASNKQYIDQEIASLVDSAPSTLDTLNELAAALGDDPNFATTVATQIGDLDTRLDQAEADILALEGVDTSINTRLTTAEGEIDTLQTDVTAIDGRLTTAEGEIDTLQTDVTAIDGRLTTAEGEIDTLQSDLSNIVLNDITDVSLASEVDGQFLKYNGANWVNSDLPIASATQSGIVTATNQTIAGQKTFTGTVVCANTGNTLFVGGMVHYGSQNTIRANTLNIVSFNGKDGNVLRILNETGHSSGTEQTAGSKIQLFSGDTNRSIIFTSNNADRIIIAHNGGISINSGSVPDAQLKVTSDSDSRKTLIVKGAVSQTANLIEAQDSSGTALFSVDASGNISSPTITALQAQTGVPTGSVISFAGSSAPTGWLICDGSAVSRTIYSDLYSIIGDTYGSGDGSTTFNTPDLRRRTVIGKGTSDALGDNEGLAENSRLIAHDHSVPAHYHGLGTLAITGNGAHTTSISHDHGAFNASGNTSGGGAHTHGLNMAETGAAGTGRYVIRDLSPSYLTNTAGGHQAVQGVVDHTHPVTLSINVPNYSANSSSDGSHSHGLSGLVGDTTSGVSGDGSMTSGDYTQPHLILNYIIKI